MEIRRITTLGVMLALAIILSIVDSMISVMIIPFLGVKLGLANAVTLIILYQFNEKDALLLAILRIILVALVRGSALQTFMISLSGGLLAVLLMVLVKRLSLFNLISVSVLGSFGHSVGQILMAIVFVGRAEVIYYLPYVLLLSVITGIFTGVIATYTLKILKTAQ